MLAPCDSEQSSRTPDCRDGRKAVDELAYWVGFNKVLGTGVVSKRLKISCPFFSAGAVEKIKAAGGEVISEKEE